MPGSDYTIFLSVVIVTESDYTIFTIVVSWTRNVSDDILLPDHSSLAVFKHVRSDMEKDRRCH